MYFKIQESLVPLWGGISQAGESALAFFLYLLLGLVILGLTGGTTYWLGQVILSLNHYGWKKFSTRNWGRLGYATTFSAFLVTTLFFVYVMLFY